MARLFDGGRGAGLEGLSRQLAKGAVIEGLDEVDGAVYHMGTASKEGRIVTAGGRVAIVVCAAPTLGEALEKCNREVGKVRCDNLFHRTDIGRKAIKCSRRQIITKMSWSASMRAEMAAGR